MKRNIIIGALLILLVIVIGVVMATKVTKDALTTDESVSTVDSTTITLESASSTDETVKGKGSLLSLLAMGRSQECTFVVRTDGVVQEGTAFYDGGNARVDTLVKSAGAKEVASYMIMDQKTNTMYLWGSAQGDQGIKMQLPDASAQTKAETSGMPTAQSEPTVAPDTDVDYDCKPWRVDGSVFVPPANIEFMDMSEMQKMMEGMGSGFPRP